ncbi:MAG: AbiH family protein, partial [Clostridium sp.]
MKILIIGNGFDLEHGLPTKYWDFMMFIKSFKKLSSLTKNEVKGIPSFQKLNENIQEYLLSDEVFNSENHSELVKELSELSSNNIWINYFIEKVDEYYEKGWIDFESEISLIIKCLEYLVDMNIHNLKTNMADYKNSDLIRNNIVTKFVSLYKGIEKQGILNNIGYQSFFGDMGKLIIDD